MKKFVTYLFFLIFNSYCHAIRFDHSGYHSSASVLPSVYNSYPKKEKLQPNRFSRQSSFHSFSPSTISQRINQHFKGFENNFGHHNFGGNFGLSKSTSSPSRYYQRVPRKTYSYSPSSNRYQPSKVSNLAHKKRQQNPYYGRKRRSAEPYTLLDPITGREIGQSKNEVGSHQRQSKNKKKFFFGLPFGLFNEGTSKQNQRFERKVPQPSLTNPYLTSSGVPLYKYRQKYPQGYSGRKKRDAPNQPWTLLDPITGRPVNPQDIDPTFDPLEAQFANPELRLNRNPDSTFRLYLDQAGRPVYRQHKRYPYTG